MTRKDTAPVICQCQHEQAAHEHNRDGTDCGLCNCYRFRRRRRRR